LTCGFIRHRLGCSVDSEIAGAEMEVETQIRGIDGVTTVKPLVDTKRSLTPKTEYVVFEVKFELLGAPLAKNIERKFCSPGCAEFLASTSLIGPRYIELMSAEQLERLERVKHLMNIMAAMCLILEAWAAAYLLWVVETLTQCQRHAPRFNQ
jgi:hypothetical protein